MFNLPYNLNIPLMLYHWSDRSNHESQTMFTSLCSIEVDVSFINSITYNFTHNITTPPFKIVVYKSSKPMLKDLYLVDKGELDIPQFILSHGKSLLDFKDSMDEYALENHLGSFWETVNSEMKNIILQKFN